VETIRRLKAEGKKVAAIARVVGLSRPTIYSVIGGGVVPMCLSRWTIPGDTIRPEGIPPPLLELTGAGPTPFLGPQDQSAPHRILVDIVDRRGRVAGVSSSRPRGIDLGSGSQRRTSGRFNGL